MDFEKFKNELINNANQTKKERDIYNELMESRINDNRN